MAWTSELQTECGDGSVYILARTIDIFYPDVFHNNILLELYPLLQREPGDDVLDDLHFSADFQPSGGRGRVETEGSELPSVVPLYLEMSRLLAQTVPEVALHHDIPGQRHTLLHHLRLRQCLHQLCHHLLHRSHLLRVL